MIKAFEMKISGSNLSVKRVSQVTTNAKNQYYAEVIALDEWEGRNINILCNGVGVAVVDGIAILPQLSAKTITIGVLSVDEDSLYNTANRNFAVLTGANAAEAEVPTESQWETYTLQMETNVELAKSYAQNPPKSIDGGEYYYIWNGTEYVESDILIPTGTGGGDSKVSTLSDYDGLNNYKGTFFELAVELSALVDVGAIVSGSVYLSDLPTGISNAEIVITKVKYNVLVGELYSSNVQPYRWHSEAITNSSTQSSEWRTYVDEVSASDVYFSDGVTLQKKLSDGSLNGADGVGVIVVDDETTALAQSALDTDNFYVWGDGNE